MKPNGHELGLVHRPRRRRPRGRPGRRRPRRPRRWSPAASRRVLVTLGGRGAVLVDRRRRLARHAPADHRRQHRRRRRLQPVRLPPRGHRGPDARRPARPRRGLRQRRRRPPRHHHPRPPPGGPHPGHGHRPRPHPRRLNPCPTSSPPTWCGSTPPSATPSRTSSASLAGLVGDAGRATDVDQLVADAFAREETSATGLPGGIAIPHCRTDRRRRSRRWPSPGSSPAVDFGAKDGPADLVFLIAAPAGGDADHLQILTQLARALVKPAFTDALRARRAPTRTWSTLVAPRARPRRRPPPPRRRPPPPRRPPRRAAAAAPPAGRPAPPGRGHRLPDRHRPHLHGRRGARGRRRAGRGRHPGRDPGLGRLDAAGPRHHRRRPTP